VLQLQTTRQFIHLFLLHSSNYFVAEYSVWLRPGQPGDRGSIPGRDERVFPPASVSRPALGPTQPLVQWVPGVLSPGINRNWGVTLTTHPHLAPRSRMSKRYRRTFSPPSVSVACSGTALGFFFSFYAAAGCETLK
jgi:hypothetical protein